MNGIFEVKEKHTVELVRENIWECVRLSIIKVVRNKTVNIGFYKLKLNIKLLLVAIISILFIGSFGAQAQAAYYVRAGANGANNGSDWTNAYTSLPDSLQRGATYYVADGSYGSYTFNDSNSGSTYINIKKATTPDHGTATGWSTAYGDGQAVWSRWTFTTSYWIVDGQTGGGPGSWESGYGFRVKTSGAGAKAVRFDNNPGHITVSHADLENSGVDVAGSSDTVYTVGCDYVTIRYCWVHNTNRTNFLINGSQNFTIEYCLVSDRHNTDGTHGEHLSANYNGTAANHIYRYNIWRDAGGANTGVIVIKDSVQSGFKIYGNIFYNTNYDKYISTNGIITDSTGDSTTNVKIYNNTFMPHRSINGDAATVSWDVSTGNEFKNNIVFNNGGFAGTSRSYNLYDSASLANGEDGGQYWSSGESALFSNPSSRDYTLKVSTSSGVSLGSEYNSDMLGNKRGTDGTWDRGSIERLSGSSGAISISPPNNLRIIK